MTDLERELLEALKAIVERGTDSPEHQAAEAVIARAECELRRPIRLGGTLAEDLARSRRILETGVYEPMVGLKKGE